MFEKLTTAEEIQSFKLGAALTMERTTLEMLGDLEDHAQRDAFSSRGAELERPGRPEHRRQNDARHGDGEADDPGGDALRSHDRRRGDADPDDPAGRDHTDEHRLDAAPGP
jgi:hypothetical protein